PPLRRGQGGTRPRVTTQTLQVVAEQFGLSPEEQRMLSSSRPGHGLLLVGPWRIHLHVIASTAEERVAMTAPRERHALAAAAGGWRRWLLRRVPRTQGYGLTSLSGNPTRCARAAEHNLSFQIENALRAAAKNG